MTRSGNVLVFKVNRADIGRVDRFGFDIFTVNYDDAGTFLGEDHGPGRRLLRLQPGARAVRKRKGRRRRRQDRPSRDLGCSSPTDNLERDDPVTLKAGKPLTVPR